MRVQFACPVCDGPVRQDLTGSPQWQCPACDHLGQLTPPSQPDVLDRCAACGNAELFRKKDFPHWLGLAILTVACAASIIPYWLYHQWWAWAILLGSALLDGLLYLWVGDVVVCYRCDAHHRGVPPQSGHQPFELTIQERYRQERLRRELMARAGPGKAD